MWSLRAEYGAMFWDLLDVLAPKLSQRESYWVHAGLSRPWLAAPAPLLPTTAVSAFQFPRRLSQVEMIAVGYTTRADDTAVVVMATAPASTPLMTDADCLLCEAAASRALRYTLPAEVGCSRWRRFNDVSSSAVCKLAVVLAPRHDGAGRSSSYSWVRVIYRQARRHWVDWVDTSTPLLLKDVLGIEADPESFYAGGGGVRFEVWLASLNMILRVYIFPQQQLRMQFGHHL